MASEKNKNIKRNTKKKPKGFSTGNKWLIVKHGLRQGVHVVFPGLLPGDKPGGAQRAAGENGTILSRMGEGDDLGGAVKAHFMVARHAAAPDGVNADLVLFPFLGAAVAAKYRQGVGAAHGVVQHQGFR